MANIEPCPGNRQYQIRLSQENGVLYRVAIVVATVGPLGIEKNIVVLLAQRLYQGCEFVNGTTVIAQESGNPELVGIVIDDNVYVQIRTGMGRFCE